MADSDPTPTASPRPPRAAKTSPAKSSSTRPATAKTAPSKPAATAKPASAAGATGRPRCRSRGSRRPRRRPRPPPHRPARARPRRHGIRPRRHDPAGPGRHRTCGRPRDRRPDGRHRRVPRPMTSPSAWAASGWPGRTPSRWRWGPSAPRAAGQARISQGFARLVVAREAQRRTGPHRHADHRARPRVQRTTGVFLLDRGPRRRSGQGGPGLARRPRLRGRLRAVLGPAPPPLSPGSHRTIGVDPVHQGGRYTPAALPRRTRSPARS